MGEWFDITPGSWAVDLAAWGGVFTGLGAIWRFGIWPFVRAVMRIADGVEKLNALIDGDVLKRLDEGSTLFAEHARRLDSHEERLGALEDGRV